LVSEKSQKKDMAVRKNARYRAEQRTVLGDMPKPVEEAFKKAFCRRCVDHDSCVKDSQTTNICKQLADRGMWDGQLPRR